MLCGKLIVASCLLIREKVSVAGKIAKLKKKGKQASLPAVTTCGNVCFLLVKRIALSFKKKKLLFFLPSPMHVSYKFF